MNFPSQIFFNDINHVYRAAILKKNALWLLPFYVVVATYFYYEKCAERCTLQLYQTSLNCFVYMALGKIVEKLGGFKGDQK